jgi:hypothetical protein
MYIPSSPPCAAGAHPVAVFFPHNTALEAFSVYCRFFKRIKSAEWIMPDLLGSGGSQALRPGACCSSVPILHRLPPHCIDCRRLRATGCMCPTAPPPPCRSAAQRDRVGFGKSSRSSCWLVSFPHLLTIVCPGLLTKTLTQGTFLDAHVLPACTDNACMYSYYGSIAVGTSPVAYNIVLDRRFQYYPRHGEYGSTRDSHLGQHSAQPGCLSAGRPI